MRPLEILTPVILAIYLLWPITGRKRPPAVGILPAFALAVIAAHANIEGMRWQMYPLYAFTAVAFLISIPEFMNARRGDTQTVRQLHILSSLVLLAASTALPILLPVPSIPVPSGPYQVGTRIYELTDTSRKELYSGKDEARRFQIQVWYPSEVGPSNERAPWMSNAEIFAPAIATYIDMPSFFLDHLALVKIPAYRESKVAPADSGYPIILFSHGWNGFNAQNTGQALELASHGYVVIGVQHTYGAIVTVFEDGTVAHNNPSALPGGAPDDEYEAAAQKLVDQWAGDVGFALDFMQSQGNDTNSPFYKSLDLSKVGVYGHSTGGGAAVQFCGTDARCNALLGMDPFMRPVSYEVLEKGVAQPAFFMFSQRWADDLDSRNNELFDQFIPNVTKSFGVISIDGTAHYDFSDLPLLSPLTPQLGLKGPINGKRVTTIINDYLLSFFDAALRNETMGLFDASPTAYPEVRFHN
jgi:platelet-activating factor acetylhydrolase isoform II